MLSMDKMSGSVKITNFLINVGFKLLGSDFEKRYNFFKNEKNVILWSDELLETSSECS